MVSVANRRQARWGHDHATCAHLRADRRRDRRNLLLSYRQVRARWTTWKFAQTSGGLVLPGRNTATDTADTGRKFLTAKFLQLSQRAGIRRKPTCAFFICARRSASI